MEMPVHGFFGQSVTGSVDEIMEANQYPDIRLFTVKRAPAATPKDDCEGSWQKSTMKSVRDFSATAYFFGKNLNKALNVPVGLIASKWGGTRIESWMTEESIREIPDINLDVALNPHSNTDAGKPSWLFNGMIAPLVHYTSKGFIWYQGESNQGNYFDYDKLMGAMVKLWRLSWKNMDMPFYYVQLAPYEYDGVEKTLLPLTIEAQYKALQYIPNAAIAPSSDLGHRTCIHPPQKKEVGQRLAFLALSHTYGMEGLPPDAPVIDMVTYEGSKAILTFKNTPDPAALGRGSFDRYTGEIKGFEMAGEDRKFYPAKANHILHNKIEVTCDRVPKPVAIRYAFRNWHEANVKTTDGLPLVPFRTDNWDDVY
jgi:sialate O-acetylesterase